MATLDQVIAQMDAAGMPMLPTDHPKWDGRIHRFGKGKKAWYVLHEIQLKSGEFSYFGAFGIWQGQESNPIKIETDWTGIGAEERAALELKQREAEERDARKKEEQAQLAANRATQQWRDASTEGNSEYAQRKQISVPGMRFSKEGDLLVPAVKYAGDEASLVGLQKIAPNGEKRFNEHMSKKSACCPIGRPAVDERIIFMAEGYATGRSVRMAMDDTLPGYVAFDAGNLLDVARVVRARHPQAHILFCADDDWQLVQRMHRELRDTHDIDSGIDVDGVQRELTSAKGIVTLVQAEYQEDACGVQFIRLTVVADGKTRIAKFENAGIAKAKMACKIVGNASVIWPLFADRGEAKWTDFNDLHVEQGLSDVRDQVSAAMIAGLVPEAAQLLAKRADEAAASSDVVELAPESGKKKSESTPFAAGAGKAQMPDASDPPESDPENSILRWEARLARSDKGAILPVLTNIYEILKNSEEWAGVVAYEEFSGQVVKLKPPPFDKGELGEWTDMDDLRTALWMQQKYSFHPREDIVMKAVLLVADLRSHHVVRAYLDPLEWDGTERLSHWMVDFLGAEDNEYVRRVGRKWMIGAVARIYKPGCKLDNVLILEGSQGLYKSTALKVLGGEWFTDAPLRFGDKDSYAIMRGRWVIELAEMDSFNKAESEAAKQFFGQYIDRYRNFYGKRASDVPRQQVFAGTTNKYVYLKDETGNRRYWPVRAIEIDLEGLRATRDLLWAEAVAAFNDGEAWWETPADVEMFRAEQESRFINDAYTDEIAKGLLGRSQVTTNEILADILKLDIAKWTMPEQQRVGRSMTQLGWLRKRGSGAGGTKRQWMYVKPESTTENKEDDDGPL
jgi:predicted P-loop ATPase/phage/plasmid primase-like uncharacterized protein